MITEVANVILQVRPDVMLTNMPKQSELPTAVKHWTLTTLLVKLIKTGAKVVHHARYATFQLAEVAIPRNVFAAILARIRHWATKARTGPPAVPTCHAQGHPTLTRGRGRT